MVKNFSIENLKSSENITKLVRAASRLNIQDLAAAMDGTEEDAESIITVSQSLLMNTIAKRIVSTRLMNLACSVRNPQLMYVSIIHTFAEHVLEYLSALEQKHQSLSEHLSEAEQPCETLLDICLV